MATGYTVTDSLNYSSSEVTQFQDLNLQKQKININQPNGIFLLAI